MNAPARNDNAGPSSSRFARLDAIDRRLARPERLAVEALDFAQWRGEVVPSVMGGLALSGDDELILRAEVFFAPELHEGV